MKFGSFRESSIEISDIASLNDKVEKSGFAGETAAFQTIVQTNVRNILIAKRLY